MKKLVTILMLACTAATAQTTQTVAATPVKTVATEEPVVNQAEKMPEFKGGQAALIQYVQTNLKYPEKEKEAKVQGRVMLSFIVENDGSLSKITVVRGIPGGERCDNEAVRLFKTMPKWTPGMDKGKEVKVQMYFPISFSLQ